MTNGLSIRYVLSRRQRLLPHLCVWGPFFTCCIVGIEAILGWKLALSAAQLEWSRMLFLGLLFSSFYVLFRGIMLGLRDVVFCRAREMNLVWEEDVIGVLMGSERLDLGLKSINKVSRYITDVWTIEFGNGAVLNIAASALSEAQIERLQAQRDAVA